MAEVSPGVWRIRYWGTGPDGAYRRRSCTVRGSRIDAERRRSELMLDHSDDAPCPTVGEAWERWARADMASRVESGDLSARSLAQYDSAWSCHVEGRWAGVQCDAVRPLEVQQWLSGLGRTQAVDGLRILRTVLDYAVRYEVAPTNPARERYLMPSRASVREQDKGIWSLDEMGQIWGECAMGSWWEASLLLCAFGGLRVGESLGVRSEDVSESSGCAVVRVERQIPERGTEPCRLKTAQSERSAVVPGAAGARLLSLAGSSGGWLAGDGLGGPSTQTRLARAWGRAELPVGRHPYRNLRNSWQTSMRWVVGLQPWAIEALMGHRGDTVTGRFYDRPSADMLAGIVAEAYARCPFDAGWDWARWD